MKKLLTVMVGSSLLFTACNDNTTQEEETVMTAAPISINQVSASPEFEGAQIAIGKVTSTPEGDNNAIVSFQFDVKNYELMNQTNDAEAKMCANSEKGQHIHFILDNEPYAALYKPEHQVTLAKNSEHYLLAFLSRSYHESIKTKGASLVYHFKVDENGTIQELDPPTEPMLFYSRPKGTYVGQNNTDNLLFDFFLWNTEISEDGNHVMAHIKGNAVDTTIVVTNWKSYFLNNMPLGEQTIELTLVDKDGNKIEGAMTNVTRAYTLAAEEPLPAE
ncbi:MAG: hypothetical protein R2800_10625 [Flavipsychrobacter sp.]